MTWVPPKIHWSFILSLWSCRLFCSCFWRVGTIHPPTGWRAVRHHHPLVQVMPEKKNWLTELQKVSRKWTGSKAAIRADTCLIQEDLVHLVLLDNRCLQISMTDGILNFSKVKLKFALTLNVVSIVSAAGGNMLKFWYNTVERYI